MSTLLLYCRFTFTSQFPKLEWEAESSAPTRQSLYQAWLRCSQPYLYIHCFRSNQLNDLPGYAGLFPHSSLCSSFILMPLLLQLILLSFVSRIWMIPGLIYLCLLVSVSCHLRPITSSGRWTLVLMEDLSRFSLRHCHCMFSQDVELRQCKDLMGRLSRLLL